MATALLSLPEIRLVHPPTARESLPTNLRLASMDRPQNPLRWLIVTPLRTVLGPLDLVVRVTQTRPLRLMALVGIRLWAV